MLSLGMEDKLSLAYGAAGKMMVLRLSLSLLRH